MDNEKQVTNTPPFPYRSPHLVISTQPSRSAGAGNNPGSLSLGGGLDNNEILNSTSLRGQYPIGTSIEDFELDTIPNDKKRKYAHDDDHTNDDDVINDDDDTANIPRSQWTVQNSDELYHITRGWGYPYFTTNDDGHVVAQAPGKVGIDLYTTVQDLVARGHNLPLIIRFKDILKDRVHLLNEAFRKAIREYDYTGDYRGVFPVKVCQQRQVVSEIVEHGASYCYGLEAGSKPELLIVLAQLTTPGALITCNGYKDSDYLETALLAQRLGQTPIIIIEKLHEIDLVLTASQKLGIRPIVGARAKLSARGIGRWSDSSGVKSKFGLSAADIMIMINKLKEVGMLDCLQLLHFHIGSQISNISAIKNALREACQYYVQLAKLGANMRYIDVGGGLGIDYDGSKTAFHASINYTEEEYAADVVVAVKDICAKHKLSCPTIISESGRAISSHHSILVFNVLSSSTLIQNQPDSIAGLFSTSTNVYKPAKTDHDLTLKMYEVLTNIGSHNLQHSLHKARQHKEESVQLFTLGLFSLPDLAKCEELYWCCMSDINTFSQELDFVPAEINELKNILSHTYFSNFSIFQSAPDVWAIDQLFPIIPIHRLDEKPTISAQLADVTCDSDGKISTFINTQSTGGDTRSTLDLHKLEAGQPYYLGMFLSGAYQEVLGSLHNLYGDTNIVHLDLNEEDPNGYEITQIIPGDTIDQVLKYCMYDTKSFLDSIRGQAERALRTKELSLQQYKTLVKHFEHALNQYTYLTSDKQ